jgi:hypothetical protein
MLRFRTLLLLIAAIALPIWLWQRADPQNVVSPDSSRTLRSTISPKATETDTGVPPSTSRTADDRLTIAARVGTDSSGMGSSEAPARTARSASVRLDVHAPASARVGDSVTITIDAEALGGIRDLSFTVVYDGRMLEFVSSSPGSFVQQTSAPGTLSAEDPSSGNVLVHMEINNGGSVAAAGTVVILEFNALHAGTSPITLRDVSVLESGRSNTSTASAERTASIIIE